MTRNDTPLTQEQSDFAAEHEDLIGKYLGIRRLPKDEYYDVVVFGYLRAVRRYLTIPALQEHKFSTIAYKAMQCDLGGYFAALRAAKRAAAVLEYDDEFHNYATAMEDPVSMQVEHTADLQETHSRLFRCLTPSQSKIVHLKVRGYSKRETAKAQGIRPKEVTAELEAARNNVIRFAPELMERAA